MFNTYRGYFKLQVYGDLSPVQSQRLFDIEAESWSILPSVTTEGKLKLTLWGSTKSDSLQMFRRCAASEHFKKNRAFQG